MSNISNALTKNKLDCCGPDKILWPPGHSLEMPILLHLSSISVAETCQILLGSSKEAQQVVGS